MYCEEMGLSSGCAEGDLSSMLAARIEDINTFPPRVGQEICSMERPWSFEWLECGGRKSLFTARMSETSSIHVSLPESIPG